VVDLAVDGTTVAVVLGMAAVSYATKAGGLWLLSRVDLTERSRTAVETLPGAVVVSLVAPELVAAGPPGWAASALVVAVARRTGSVLLALVVGVGTVALLRGVAG
jgi:uncharacterized membrane protein